MVTPRIDRILQAIFAGQQGARMAGALLAGGILPVLALLFAFPNREYLAGAYISVLGLASALLGWQGRRANRRAPQHQARRTRR